MRARSDGVFAALVDATRRDILLRVLQQEASVSGLARNYAMSFAAVQEHVSVPMGQLDEVLLTSV